MRARDIQILFADASTGARSPALVHQGRIGEIIQAKPEQRRRVLEEAAGISGLHARRHEAELRLRAAEQNLARLEDVIGQLAGQIDALKRQARQAVRYRALSQNIRKAEAALFHLRLVQAQDRGDPGATPPTLRRMREVAERTGAEAEAATRQANAAADLPALREGEAEAAAVLQRLVAAREALEREAARARERIAELARRLVQLGARLRARAPALGRCRGRAGAPADRARALAREAAAGAERRTGVETRAGAAGDDARRERSPLRRTRPRRSPT